MFVLLRDAVPVQRVIATLLAAALVLWASGAFNTVRAANLTSVSDTLSDSAPGASSDHTIAFTHPAGSTGVANGEDIVLTFPAVFDLTGIGTEDVSLAVDGTDFGQANWSMVNGGSDLTITIDTGNIAAGSSTVIIIGNGASVDGDTPDSQIVNPSTTDDPNVSNSINGNESYEIDISAGANDSGHTRVVILNTVLITATVDTVFNFVVYENDVGENVNGAVTTASSSTTTIPFGTLVQYTPVIISQDLTVETNAINGFVVTAEIDQPLLSSTGADIDEFKDDVTVTVPEAWESPSVGLNVVDENTWGHWGITTEDATTTRANEFGNNEWAGVSTTPTVIYSHSGPADAVTPGIGSTTVGYQVEISPLQEAADDYSTILTYIATPTF